MGIPAAIKSRRFAQSNIDLETLSYQQPSDKVARLEAIYHLVYMIYLDDVIEDVELEVASIFAKALGFKPGIVSDLFKSIATLDYDGTTERNVHAEVLDFLAVNDV